MTQPGTAAPEGGAPGNPNPAGSAPASAPSWYEGAAPELASWVGEQKFSDLNSALTAHKSLLSMRGVPANELVRVPNGWDEKPETAAEIYARLGRPEKADEYEVAGIPVGEGDHDLAPGFKAKAHEVGLSKRQAKALAEWFQGEGSTYSTKRQEAVSARLAEEDVALKAEWGGAYAENELAAANAAKMLAAKVGFDAQPLDKLFQSAFGYANGMKVLALIGRSLGEHKPVHSDSQSGGEFGMTPAAANAKADALNIEIGQMKPGDPSLEAKMEERTRLRFIATGEERPDWLKKRA